MIIVILAGGNSARMGRDKAAIPIDGEPMLKRVCNEAAKVGVPVLVVGRDAQDAGFQMPGVEFVSDTTPGQGPLSALLTALKWLNGKSDVLLCACDMPRVKAEAFEWLGMKWRTTATQALWPYLDTGTNESSIPWALVPVIDGRDQPMFAYYSAGCAGRIGVLLKDGDRSMKSLLNNVAVRRINVPEILLGQLIDVDTPEDLQQLT